MRSHFDHLRAEDSEHVGYIEMDGGLFVPYDRLWNRRGEPMDLDDAEALLDRIGLSLLAENWLLLPEPAEGGEPVRVRIAELTRDTVTVSPTLADTSGKVAKSVDLTRRTTIALPTDRLRPA